MRRRSSRRPRQRRARGRAGRVTSPLSAIGFGLGVGQPLRMLLPPALQFAQMLPGLGTLALAWRDSSSPTRSTSGLSAAYSELMRLQEPFSYEPTATPGGGGGSIAPEVIVQLPGDVQYLPRTLAQSPDATPIPSWEGNSPELLLQSLMQNPLG